MNDELDMLLQDVLGPSGRYDARKAESVKREVTAMYESKLKMWRQIIWALLALDGLMMLGAVWLFSISSDVKWLIGSAAVGLWAYESTILMKLWYWQMNTKYSVLKEVTELKLQIAKLSEKDGE